MSSRLNLPMYIPAEIDKLGLSSINNKYNLKPKLNKLYMHNTVMPTIGIDGHLRRREIKEATVTSGAGVETLSYIPAITPAKGEHWVINRYSVRRTTGAAAAGRSALRRRISGATEIYLEVTGSSHYATANVDLYYGDELLFNVLTANAGDIFTISIDVAIETWRIR